MCRTKVVQHGAFSGPLATEYAQHEAFAGSLAKKFARQPALLGASAKKFARQAIKRHFWGIFRALGELFRAHANNKPRRENFVPDPGPVPVQNSPRTQPGGPTRYKTLPARPKYPFSAHFEPAGRVLYRFHHHQAEQGEKSHAPTPHLTPVTCPPPIPHAIHLNELSTKPRNVAIPTITIQISKYSQGNCMRNWRGRIRGWRQGQASNTRPTGTPDWSPLRGLRGLARLRDDAPNQTSATQAPLVWRAPEGPGGQAGLRDRTLRAFRLACGDLAGGRARRRPEHPWGHQQQRAARTARGRAAAHGHTKQPGPTKHTRRPEHQRHHKQRRKSGGRSNAENQVE